VIGLLYALLVVSPPLQAEDPEGYASKKQADLTSMLDMKPVESSSRRSPSGGHPAEAWGGIHPPDLLERVSREAGIEKHIGI